MYRERIATPSQLFALKKSSSTNYAVVLVAALAAPVAVLYFQTADFEAMAPLHALLPWVVALGGSLGLTAAWFARGRVIALFVKNGEVSLIGRSGRAIGRAWISDAAAQPVVVTWQGMSYPAVALEVAGRRVVIMIQRLDVQWTYAGADTQPTCRLAGDKLWPALVAALELDQALATPAIPTQAPSGPPRLQFPWPVLTLPLAVGAGVKLVKLYAKLFPPPQPPSTECVRAARCCFADVNSRPPVAPSAVSRCIALAESPRSACLAPAARSCRPWRLEQASHWQWSAEAQQVPPRDSTAPAHELYPRLSCKQATDRLLAAVREHKNGGWLAIRTNDLFIKALSPNDPDAFLYCDGYPIPIHAGNTMGSSKIMLEPPGPHTVLVRPLATGLYQIGQYCIGCDSVGREKSDRGAVP